MNIYPLGLMLINVNPGGCFYGMTKKNICLFPLSVVISEYKYKCIGRKVMTEQKKKSRKNTRKNTRRKKYNSSNSTQISIKSKLLSIFLVYSGWLLYLSCHHIMEINHPQTVEL
jgi:ATP/ADP translocase